MSRAPLRWRLILSLLGRLPQGALSRAAGRLADLRLPKVVQGGVNRVFARAVGARLDEAELAPEAYPSLGAFFVRRLKAGTRHWPTDPTRPTSPVDGIMGAKGTIREGTALQAKGMPYSVAEILGDASEADRFDGGTYLTIYLSPRHYHRIHAPVTGKIHRARAIPGRLLPVNLPAVEEVADLFPRNERLVALLRDEARNTDVAVIAVGAYNVGRIAAAFDSDWNGPDGRGVTNRSGRPAVEVREYEPPIDVSRGEEIMAFHLGSTVVVLFGPTSGAEALEFGDELREGQEIQLGDGLFGVGE